MRFATQMAAFCCGLRSLLSARLTMFALKTLEKENLSGLLLGGSSGDLEVPVSITSGAEGCLVRLQKERNGRKGVLQGPTSCLLPPPRLSACPLPPTQTLPSGELCPGLPSQGCLPFHPLPLNQEIPQGRTVCPACHQRAESQC